MDPKAMEPLNFHHLHYFWTVAREGSVSAAARRLSVSQPTVSGQLRQLERTLGEPLIRRVGRRIELTETGRIVRAYADDIFALGQELTHILDGQPSGRPLRLSVGISDVIPKLVAWRVIQPALGIDVPLRLACVQDKPERLVAELRMHNLDLVLTDSPVSGAGRTRTYSHLLGECPVSFFAPPGRLTAYRKGFPRSLEAAPFLLPAEGTNLRQSLENWFAERGVRPQIVGEFDDPALLKVFARGGLGCFAAPSVVDDEVHRQYGVRRIAVVRELREGFYVVSAERKLRHPAVVAIHQAARSEIFAEPHPSRTASQIV